MALEREERIVEALLARHGRTYCEELGIDIAGNTPSALFRWLVATILFAARIGSANATEAAIALYRAGLVTSRKMAASRWEDRVEILTTHGYKRFDESAAEKLGAAAETLETEYGGDLRKLRRAAGNDPEEIRRRLDAFKGLGEVGVDIFCREAQLAWRELWPFADRKSLGVARRLGLPEDAAELAKLVPEEEFARLVAALVRTALHDDHEAILAKAAEPRETR